MSAVLSLSCILHTFQGKFCSWGLTNSRGIKQVCFVHRICVSAVYMLSCPIKAEMASLSLNPGISWRWLSEFYSATELLHTWFTACRILLQTCCNLSEQQLLAVYKEEVRWCFQWPHLQGYAIHVFTIVSSALQINTDQDHSYLQNCFYQQAYIKDTALAPR
jgi:hypothetical protein